MTKRELELKVQLLEKQKAALEKKMADKKEKYGPYRQHHFEKADETSRK